MNRAIVNRRLRRCLRILAGLVVLAAAMLAWQLLDYTRELRQERQLALARSDAPAAELQTPAMRLARAQVLVNGLGADAAEAALDLYREVEAEGGESLRRLARYDTANLYIRQSQEEVARGEPGRAVPLIELAKGIYRGLLRDDPSDWDLRYNLERAVRLLPEADPDAQDLVPAAPESAEIAPTTARGTSMGMP